MDHEAQLAIPNACHCTDPESEVGILENNFSKDEQQMELDGTENSSSGGEQEMETDVAGVSDFKDDLSKEEPNEQNDADSCNMTNPIRKL